MPGGSPLAEKAELRAWRKPGVDSVRWANLESGWPSSPEDCLRLQSKGRARAFGAKRRWRANSSFLAGRAGTFMSSAAGEPTTTKELGVEIRFRLTLRGDRCGRSAVGRLEGFAKAFRAATLKSAQASLSIPSFRHSLGDEPRPDYRLVDLTDGSTTLVLASSDDRPVTREAVSRHLEAVEEYDRTGAWPPYVYPGGLQAWAEVYQTLFRRASGAGAVGGRDGPGRPGARSHVGNLAREPIRPL